MRLHNCVVTLTMLVLAMIMLMISPPRWQLRRLALISLQPLQARLASLAVAVPAVCGGDGPDGVLDLPHFDLPVHCRGLGVPPGSAGHGAGL